MVSQLLANYSNWINIADIGCHENQIHDSNILLCYKKVFIYDTYLFDNYL
ncbi:unnamed protein product [Clonostachys rosea]|uniref:Uncharacterized protein n=1 Tax=Bionectria ochroleuca TaxID=29856 RepID=A0ABY6UKY8_BIOOC|nr:unnamed protein product [Clonostachys rosea]